MSAMSNRRVKDKKRRAKLRAKLVAKGVSEAEIEQIIERRRRYDLSARQAADKRPAENAYRYDPDNDAGHYPDDSGFKPTPGDSLLRGAGRPSGVTAKVARRRNTVTRFEYERMAGDGS